MMQLTIRSAGPAPFASILHFGFEDLHEGPICKSHESITSAYRCCHQRKH